MAQQSLARRFVALAIPALSQDGPTKSGPTICGSGNTGPVAGWANKVGPDDLWLCGFGQKKCVQSRLRSAQSQYYQNHKSSGQTLLGHPATGPVLPEPQIVGPDCVAPSCDGASIATATNPW